jgi:flavocytochrome c
MITKKLVALGIALAAAAALFTGCSVGKAYDVVVIGSGAAGLSAAIEAASAGAKVALLEKQAIVGGSTLIAGGYVYGTGTAAQQKLGIKDSPEDLAKYWSDRAEGQADPAMLKFVAEKSGATIDWLVGLGARFGDPIPTGTSPVRRGFLSPEGGPGIVNPLKKEAEAKGVTFFMETPATKLLTSKGAVTGVSAKGKDGKTITFNAKSVVIATGGFDRSKELFTKYAPAYDGAFTYVSAGNTGDGLVMGQKVGAATSGKGGIIGFRGVPGEATLESPIGGLMWMPFLYVNKEGKRFVNETADYPVFHQALNKQTDKTSFLIFDATTYAPALDKGIEKNVAWVADTLPALAAAAGIDEAGLVATVAEYNAMIKKGKDTQFGKSLKGMKPIAKPKFYALSVAAASLGTMTGLKIDLDAHVLNAKGEIIPGLFAAGEVANGDFFNQEYPASGTSIQMCLTFGRVAGANAAAGLKK